MEVITIVENYIVIQRYCGTAMYYSRYITFDSCGLEENKVVKLLLLRKMKLLLQWKTALSAGRIVRGLMSFN